VRLKKGIEQRWKEMNLKMWVGLCPEREWTLLKSLTRRLTSSEWDF
jgi:hypothetical protein